MSTAQDAELMMKLYDLRREASLRKARHYLIFEFAPKDAAEFLKLATGAGTDEQAYWRQATSYWEMAASFVLRGAVDPDLYFDSNGEGLFLYAKYFPFAADYEKATGFPAAPANHTACCKVSCSEGAVRDHPEDAGGARSQAALAAGSLLFRPLKSMAFGTCRRGDFPNCVGCATLSEGVTRNFAPRKVQLGTRIVRLPERILRYGESDLERTDTGGKR